MVGYERPRLYRTDAETGWSLKPSINTYRSQEGGAVVKTNSYGYRGHEWTLQPEGGVFRIAVFGDSFTEALQIDATKTWVEMLPKEMALIDGCELLEEFPNGAETLNFGVGGYGTGQSWLTWRKIGRKFSPHLTLYRCAYRFFSIIDSITFFVILRTRNTVEFYSTGRLGDNAVDLVFLLDILQQHQSIHKIDYYVKPHLVHPLTAVLDLRVPIRICPFPPSSPLALPLWRNLYGQSDYLLHASKGAQASYQQLCEAGNVHLCKGPLSFPHIIPRSHSYVLSDHLSTNNPLMNFDKLNLGSNPILIVNPEPLSGQLPLQEVFNVSTTAVELASMGLNIYCTNPLPESLLSTPENDRLCEVKILSLSLASLLRCADRWSMIIGVPSGPFWFSISSKIPHIFTICTHETVDLIPSITTFRTISEMKSSSIYKDLIANLVSSL